MFDVLEKRETQRHERLLREFARQIRKLRGAKESIQSSVGRGINIANSMFMQRFGSAEKFQVLSSDEQIQYIESLTKAEERFTRRWPTMAIGFSLFKLWLEALIEEDEASVKHFSRGLAVLSAKGGEGVYCSFQTANSPGSRLRSAIKLTCAAKAASP